MTTRIVVLDACVLINLSATEQLLMIAGANECVFGVARIAAAESLYYERPGVDGPERVAIDASRLAAEGSLQILELELSEIERFVTIATELDDGEAATIAIGVARGLSISTDDRRALRYLNDHHAGMAVETTSTLVRSWADRTSADRLAIRRMLERIRDGAQFVPNDSDPNSDWWLTILNSA